MHSRPVSSMRAYITARRSCPRWASQSTETMRTAGRWNPLPSRPRPVALPVLLVQADDDRDVPHQTAELIEDLRSRNIDHDVIMIPNEIHVMARYASWMILFNATNVYFDRHLDKRGPPIRKQVQYSGFDRRYVGPSLSQAQ